MMMFTGLRLPIVPGKEKKTAKKVLTVTGALDGEFSFFSFCKKNQCIEHQRIFYSLRHWML